MSSFNNGTKQRSGINILRSSLFSILVLWIFLLSGCGGGGSGSSTPQNQVNPNNTKNQAIVLVSPNNLNQIDLVNNYPQKLLIAAIDSHGNRRLITQKDGLIFVIANPNLAKIDESSNLTSLVESGNTVITATFDKLPPLKITVNIEPAILTGITALAIQTNDSSIILPESYHTEINAQGTFSDGKMRDISAYSGLWSSNASNIAFESDTVFGTSVFGISAGNATISAKLDRLESSINVNVVNAVLNQIDLAPNNITIPSDAKLDMTATGTFNYNGSLLQTQLDITHNVLWQVESSKFATIDPIMGILTPKESGLVVVKALSINGMSNTASLTISDRTLNSLSAKPSSVTLDKGLTSTPITIWANYSDGTSANITSSVKITNATSNVITVNSVVANKFTVTAQHVGTTTISAIFDGQTVEIPVKVNPASVVQLKVQPTIVHLPAGTESQLTATAILTDRTPQNVTTAPGIHWVSNDKGIVTVGANNGRIKGVKNGVATTVSATYGGHSGSATVKVDNSVIASVFISGNESGTDVLNSIDNLPVGIAKQLYPYAKYSDNSIEPLQQKTWGISGSLTIESSTNILTGTAPVSGELTLSYSANPALNITIPVTISDAIAQSLSIQTNGHNALPNGESAQLTAMAKFSDGTSQDVTSQANWDSSQSTIISVGSNTGIVTANASNGSAEISATYGGVAPAKTTITAAPPAIVKIVLNFESTVLISGGSQYPVHVHAWGYYSNSMESQDVTKLVDWSYDSQLIHIDPNTGLITVVTPFKGNTTTSVYATDQVTRVSSDPTTLQLESWAISALKFDSSSSCYTYSGSTICNLVLNASFNDGTTIPQFVDFKGNLKDIFANTTSDPTGKKPTAVNIDNTGTTIQLRYEGILLKEVTPRVDYNGVTSTGKALTTHPLMKF